MMCFVLKGNYVCKTDLELCWNFWGVQRENSNDSGESNNFALVYVYQEVTVLVTESEL